MAAAEPSATLFGSRPFRLFSTVWPRRPFRHFCPFGFAWLFFDHWPLDPFSGHMRSVSDNHGTFRAQLLGGPPPAGRFPPRTWDASPFR